MAIFAIDFVAAAIFVLMCPVAWHLTIRPPARHRPSRGSAILFAVVVTWSAFRFSFLVAERLS